MGADVYHPAVDSTLDATFDSPRTKFQLLPLERTTPPPSFYAHPSTEAVETSDDADMYRGNSNAYRGGRGGGRGTYSSSRPNGQNHLYSTGLGSRNTGHSIVKPPPSPQSPSVNRSGSHGSYQQRTSDRAITCGGNRNWVHQQELKIRVMGIPRGCWTHHVYRALFEFGTIVRIEIQRGSVDCSAWVTFQPPPSQSLWNHAIKIEETRVRVEQSNVRIFTVPSPVNPANAYNEFNIIYANSIDFGIRVADTSMMIMRTVRAMEKVQVTLNLKRKEIDIQFPFVLDGNLRRFRFQMPLSLLSHIDRATDPKTGQSVLTIPFDSPPKFYMQLEKSRIEESFSPSDKTWNEWNSWDRQTEVVDSKTRETIKAQPLTHLKDAATIDIGRWTTYRLLFNTSTLRGSKFEEFSSALADYGVPIKARSAYTLVPRNNPLLWNALQDEVSITHSRFQLSVADSAFDELSTGQVHLTFPVRYQLEACLTHGFLKEHQITRSFLERLASMDPAEATYLLEKVAERPSVQQIVLHDPMNMFDVRITGRLSKKVPSYCVISRAVNITPTMMHVSTPVVETSNRIVRKYATDIDRFIRVKFSDERTEGKVSQGNNRSEAVFDRIRRAMNEGIVVAGRYYEFLAFGNSQFRENGAFFYAPTSSMTAADIRRAMGSFDHIRAVAKFGARLGQCFSTTRFIHNATVVIDNIKDIETTPNAKGQKFTFTDGVGKISRFLAQMAAEELGIQNPFDDPPSLYQFRLAGLKGVLAIDPSLMGTRIQVRPSQFKFEGFSRGLEIIRASAFAAPVFNRQLILVLSTLGVPDHVFIRKQQEMVNDLEMVIKDRSVALNKLSRLIDFNRTTLTMVAMILDGFMDSREPFMMLLLHLWRSWHIKFLKEKARIGIEEGAFVLGCVDETVTLRGHYDNPQSRPDATRDEKLATLPEIFLQISDPDRKGHYKVVQGICILARNPSLHPGDIRVVQAVDVSALHHMKNVVVLPQTGDRDLANMCSGGDLDGDDYLVMWDSDFIPETINEIPMDFTPPEPEKLDRSVTVRDMTDFFVTYMKNDSLARIALAHLAQADFNEEGVRDETCLELARLHSQAVDYPKSGIPAIMERDLKPKKWPHFMDNKYRAENQIYRSKKILGMLYDQVQLVDFQLQYKNAFDSRILDAFELDESVLKVAMALKDEYDGSLRRLMAKHAIRTEFEAWSVFVLSHNYEGGGEYKFAEEFGGVVRNVKDGARTACIEATNKLGCGIACFVAAMYTVTAREMKAALEECHRVKIVGGQEVPVREMDPEHMPLMSFPWLFHDELGRIATGDRSGRLPIIVPQGPPKHHKKHVDLEVLIEAEVGGNVETKEGITHYGELLKLDFGPAQSKGAELEVRRGSETVAKGPPPEPIQDIIQAAAFGEGINESGSTETLSRSGSEQTETDSGDENNESAERTMKLTTRVSAMDRLIQNSWM